MMYFLTFASSNMSCKRLTKEAEDSKLFDKVYGLTEKDLPEDFQQILKERIEKYGMRGYGYWSWKPYIIKHMLDMMNDDDILIYMDGGSKLNINEKSIVNFNKYINQTINNNIGFYRAPGKIKYFSTKELITTVSEYFGYNYPDVELMNNEIQASTIILIKNKFTDTLISDWLNITNRYFDVTTDIYNSCKQCNGFIRNQHDQSLLSLILTYYKCQSLKNIKSWTNNNWESIIDMPFWDYRKRYD